MAHNEYEIRTLLIHNFTFDYDFYMFHYKTVKCPYITNHDNRWIVFIGMITKIIEEKSNYNHKYVNVMIKIVKIVITNTNTITILWYLRL